MAAVDPIVSFARCVEDSRNENDCVLINFFYEKIPNIVDDYLAFPFRACYHILTYGIVLKNFKRTLRKINNGITIYRTNQKLTK